MNAERALVLVADDEEDILQLVTAVLRSGGFDVVTARDGAEALDLVRDRGPRAVVLDVAMPELDGIEVLRRLRAEPSTAELPVVLLSARAQENDVERGYAAGASAYVRKPFKPAELLATVEDLVG